MGTLSKNTIAENFELNGDVQFSIIDVLKKFNVDFTKNFAGTGTLYIGLKDEEGSDYKLRIANHDKGDINYSGRECDGNIIYSNDSDQSDIANMIMEELPWEMMVKE